MDAGEAIDNGRYRLVELLGSGGMAAVYRAWDERLKAWRAVKVLHPRASASASVRARFEDEARAMARLQHRNILTVHEFGFDGDRPFIVMELVAGGSLAEVVEARGPLRPALACELLAGVLDALQFAHDNHVVHRDIKPHNVLLTADGHPLVGDFGIARVGGDLESERTRTGATMGTLAYMAPEQRASARRVDGRADVYAVGNTLFAVLTGLEPFDLYTLDEGDPQLERVPEALRPVLLKATQHKPELRYQTAGEMAEILRAVRVDVEHVASGVAQLPAPTLWDTAPPLTPPPSTPAPHTEPPSAPTFADLESLGDPAPPAPPPLEDAGSPAVDDPGTGRSWGPLVIGLGLLLGLGGLGAALVCTGGVLGTGAVVATTADVSPSRGADFRVPRGKPLTPDLVRKALTRSLERQDEALRRCVDQAEGALSTRMDLVVSVAPEANALEPSFAPVPEPELVDCLRAALLAMDGPRLADGVRPMAVRVVMDFDRAGYDRVEVSTEPRRTHRIVELPWDYELRREAPGASGVWELEQVSVEKNEVVDEGRWFAENALSVPAWAPSSGFASDISWGPDPGVPSTTGLGDPPRVVLDGHRRIGLFDKALVVYDDLGEPDVVFDFTAVDRAPRTRRNDEMFTEQEVTWALAVDDVLYVSSGHRTYARSSFGDNAYLTAFDLESGALLWRSRPLVANGRNFLVRGNTIVSGYGFTAEDDFVFLLDRTTGRVRERLGVRSGPDWFIPKDPRLFVRTYNRNYVFEVRGE